MGVINRLRVLLARIAWGKWRALAVCMFGSYLVFRGVTAIYAPAGDILAGLLIFASGAFVLNVDGRS